MEYTIDAETDVAYVAARLQMNITGALIESVLQQPIHDVDDVFVVGIRRLGFTQFQHGFQVLHHAGAFMRLPGTVDRVGQLIKLNPVTLDITGSGQHPLYLPAGDVFHIADPAFNQRLSAGYHDGICADLYCQNAVPLRKSVGHHIRNGRHVHIQRVDLHEFHVVLTRQPFDQRVFIQHPAALAGIGIALPAQQGECMQTLFVRLTAQALCQSAVFCRK